MHQLRRLAARAHRNEEGHMVPAVASLVGGAGILLIGIGAASDRDGLAVIGGIVGGLGMVAVYTLDHLKVEWEMLKRLDDLEKK